MLTENRKNILRHVYDMNTKDPYAIYFLSQKIMDSLGLEEDQYTIDVRYLIDEGLLKVPSPKAHGIAWPLGVNITHKGKKLVESELGEQEPPEKKPPLGFLKKR